MTTHTSRGTNMNSLNENNILKQQARDWSVQLGELAAERPSRVFPPSASAGIASPLPSPLAAILTHIRQRNQKREDMEDKMRAAEFMRPM